MTIFKTHQQWFWIILLVLPYLLFAIYSYSQTDPNLVISNNNVYWNFQQQMWQLGYHQRELSARIYVLLVGGMFVSYFFGVRILRNLEVSKVKIFVLSLVLVLLVSYPALSHDLFNYMFNARMVMKYQMNPHVHTAVEISSDVWVRFMNNIDTPAPYGYGWTALSLIPYSLGLNKFNPTFYAFKFFMIGGFALLFWTQTQVARELKDKAFRWKKWLFFLNPLVVVETISTVHNDVWMMALYFLSLLFILKMQKAKEIALRFKFLVASLVFFIVSVSIKFVTILLLPVVVIQSAPSLLPKKMTEFVREYWADLSSILLLIPLFTVRSQQFHPWYLFWSLSFLPFMRSSKLRLLLIAFSVSSLLRYVPYLSIGGYTAESLSNERMITWVGGLVVFVLFYLMSLLLPKKHAMLE